MTGGDYQARLVSEVRRYGSCLDVHALPEIFHYWSNRYLRPRFLELGFSSPNDLFQKALDRSCDGSGFRRFLSLGAGNCDLEIQLASNLVARGLTDFVIDCVELNAQMLERGRLSAAEHKVSAQLNLIQADLNSWTPVAQYDVVFSNQALHHLVNLEGLFAHIKNSLAPGGKFAIVDTIGRNGHLRWPEALDLVREFWRKLPPSYRYNVLLDRYEEMFEDWDCSQDGFEGIRAQDILPLLVREFHFTLFVGYGNLMDPFLDRSFGYHFDATAEWDRAFVDQLQQRNEQGLASGELKPTQMAAIVSNEDTGGLSPARYVRNPAMNQTARADRSKEFIENPYEWQAWPNQVELLCARLKASDLRIRESQRQELAAAGALDDLTKETKDRIEWGMRINRELEERTAWCHKLQTELQAQLDERTAWCQSLQSELQTERAERTALVARMDRELEECAAVAERRRVDLEDRTKWALDLQSSLEERTAWAMALQSELETEPRAPRNGWVRRALRKLKR